METDRRLTVLADGEPFASGSRFRLTGKARIGLYPSLFLLECWNLPDSEVYRLQNNRELSVLHGDSCLAFGRVSDVFCRTVPEGTVTTAAFSLGLDLWEALVSLPVPAGASVSETVRSLLEASGTGIRLLSFPGSDPVISRGQAFCGRAAECIAEALTAAGARGLPAQREHGAELQFSQAVKFFQRIHMACTQLCDKLINLLNVPFLLVLNTIKKAVILNLAELLVQLSD